MTILPALISLAELQHRVRDGCGRYHGRTCWCHEYAKAACEACQIDGRAHGQIASCMPLLLS
jgi:hypothetical protein